MARILIVEDDVALARGLIALLKAAGYAIDHVKEGADVQSIDAMDEYALIILDVGLPDISGFDVLKQLRRSGSNTPVLLLTARDAVKDRVTGLDLGGDDYMVKPFEPTELAARVRVLVRRTQGAATSVLTVGDLVCDLSTGVATIAGQPLDLRRREWAVLIGLASRVGKVVTKERLVSEVFGQSEPVGPNALELYVARLRKKLPDTGPQIRTLRGLGYILENK
jgi:two-component system response regulator TctD